MKYDIGWDYDTPEPTQDYIDEEEYGEAEYIPTETQPKEDPLPKGYIQVREDFICKFEDISTFDTRSEGKYSRYYNIVIGVKGKEYVISTHHSRKAAIKEMREFILEHAPKEDTLL